MQDPARTQASTIAATSPPVSKQGGVPDWVPIVALFLSISTLAKTLYTDWRASRAKQLTKFEADYGTPLRQAIRTFEKGTMNALRTYTLASALTVEELRNEIAKEQQKWLGEIYEVSRLLEEIDSSGYLATDPWADDFKAKADEAETHILAMTDTSATTVTHIATCAVSARTELQIAVAGVRTAHRSEGASYDRWGCRR